MAQARQVSPAAAIDRLISKLAQRDSVSDAERQVLADTVSRVEEYPADADIVRENQPLTESRLVLDGLVIRYKTVPDGGRQIIALHIAGDFIDLHSFTLKKLDHSIGSLTPVRLAVVPHAALTRITETQPHLTRLLWLSTMLDAAQHREWLVSSGRRSSLAHVAHFLCEMLLRSQVAGLAEGRSYPLPITQDELADICGITPVHANRTMQELRSAGAVEWKRGMVTVLDWPGLQHIAAFDPTFLYLESMPR